MKYIKLIVLGILATISCGAQAQRLIDSLEFDTHKEYMDVLLSNLIENDSALFKNKILYDRVVPFSNLNAFNTAGHDTANYDLFLSAWKELDEANLSKSQRMTVEHVDAIAFSTEMEKTISLGVINIDYTTLDTLALDSIALADKTDGLYIDSNGLLARTTGAMPYVDKHKLMIAPLASRLIYGDSIKLALSPMFMDKASESISDLSVTFGGTTVNLLQNDTVLNLVAEFIFTTSGTQTFSFTTSLSNGAVFETYATVEANLVYPLVNNQIQQITASEPFMGYDELWPCGFSDGIYGSSSCYGQGEYLVFLADGHTELTKPVIIMDGFDPQDRRKIMEVSSQGEESIYSLMDFGIGQNFIKLLRTQGHDVIVLNFPRYKNGTGTVPYSNQEALYDALCSPVLDGLSIQPTTIDGTVYYQNYRDGGADYIERNAMVLRELIVQTNQTLVANGSQESLVVIGPSMGGLISRVALRQMELDGLQHNTRLYVSFDSPHKGANISMGIQRLMQRTAADALYQLNTPAAKQMLLSHYATQPNYGFPTPDPYRSNTFAPLLNTLGFPQQTERNVSLINGVLSGDEIGVAGHKFIDLTAFWSEVEIRRTKHTGTTGVMKYRKFPHGSGWKHSKTDEVYGSLDSSPGGAIELKRDVIEKWNGNVPGIIFGDYGTSYTSEVNDETCFIPTKSALAYSGPNTLWREDLSCENLICKGWTPFDNYFAPSENQFHVAINQESVDWLMDEINETPDFINYDLGAFCPNFNTQIEGESVLCKDDIATYTINNDCGIAYWEASSGIEILTSDFNSVTVKKLSTVSVNKWVKAVMWTGDEEIKYIVSKPFVLWGLDEFNVTTNVYELSLTTWQQSLEDQGVETSDIVWTQTGGNGTLTVSPDKLSATATHSSWPFIVTGTVAISNACGTTTRSFVATDPLTSLSGLNFNSSTGWGSLIILNAAESQNSYIVIDPDNIGSAEISSSELYDIFGNQVETFIHNQDHVDVDNATGAPLTRILQVSMNGKTQQKTIIVH